MKFVLIFCAIFSTVLIQSSSADELKPITSTNIDKLKKYLLKDYDPDARPADDQVVTNVKVGFTVIDVDIDETQSSMITHGWMKFEWTDNKLAWDPNEYGNISVIRLPESAIWKPDIVLYNNMDLSVPNNYGSASVVVYTPGKVLWVPPTTLHSTCELKLSNWPFDTHACILKFGSWVYDGFRLNLTNEPVDLENMIKTSNWKLIATNSTTNEKFYPCCPEPYDDVTFTLTLQRKSTLQAQSLCAAACLTTLLVLISFWIHPNQVLTKYLLNIVAGLICCTLLVYLSTVLPVSTDNVPKTVRFFYCSTFMILISIIVTTFIVNIAKNKGPQCLLTATKNTFLYRMMGSGSCANDDIAQKEILKQEEDFVVVAKIFDRLVFIIYFILFAICLLL
jgi:hypothetical protein